MNPLGKDIPWSELVGVALLVSTGPPFLARWPWARLWWAIAAGVALFMLPAKIGDTWELRFLLWSAPIVIGFVRHFQALGQLPGERFATRKELRWHLVKANTDQAHRAILIGTSWRRHLWWYKPSWVVAGATTDRPEVGHGLIVAPTGLGKGLAIVTQLLQNTHHSAVVLDLKGEVYRLTSGARAVAGHRIVRLDLSGNSRGHRWDPTAAAADEDDLRVIAQALTHDPRDRDPFWAQAAEEILTAAMLAARASNCSVFPFLRGLFDLGIRDAAGLIQQISPALGARFLAGGHTQSKVLQGIWVTLLARLRPMLTNRLLGVLGGNDFTVADLRRERTTVYITVPEAHLERLAPTLAALWTGLVSALVAHADAMLEMDLHPLLLVLDEAGRIPIPRLPGYLATLRSRRVACLVYVQSNSQLVEMYGPDQARSISNNCALHIFYQQHDEETARAVSRRLGETSAFAHGYSLAETSSIMGFGSVTRTVTERPRPLMSPQEVMRLPEDTVLAFYRDLLPMWIGRLDWRKHPSLRTMASMTPVPLPLLTPATETVQTSDAFLNTTAISSYVDPDS